MAFMQYVVGFREKQIVSQRDDFASDFGFVWPPIFDAFFDLFFGRWGIDFGSILVPFWSPGWPRDAQEGSWGDRP